MALSVTATFDGACWPNPGGTATYGYTLVGLTEAPLEGAGVAAQGPGATNNVAEYHGLLALVRRVAASNALRAGDRLDITGDSALVVNTVNGNWKPKAPHLRELRDAVLRELRALDCAWSLRWVGRGGNGAADALAAEAFAAATGRGLPEFRRPAPTS